MKVEYKKNTCKYSEVKIGQPFMYRNSIYVKCEPFPNTNPDLVCLDGFDKSVKYPYITYLSTNCDVKLLENVFVEF